MSEFRQRRPTVNPIKVDIVGDFAGRGLFVIHGEALLTHCLENARVDFDYGFQLLHAVHAVEVFLAKLKDRGCIFHILWFEKEADICMPVEVRADGSRASKYRLTRAVLIQHFSCPVKVEEDQAARFSFLFPNLQSDSVRKYLDGHPLHFFLGSSAHGGSGGASDIRSPLEMVYIMASAGYCVAFIEGVEFQSAKAYLYMSTPWGNITPLLVREKQLPPLSEASILMAETMKRLAGIGIAAKLTAREFISICALSLALSSEPQGTRENGRLRHREAATVILHLVVLRHCSLSQRSFPQQEPSIETFLSTPFLVKFFEAARDGISGWFEGGVAGLKWDAFDLFDGRLYINVSARLSDIPLPQQIFQEVTEMVKLLGALSGVDISDSLSGMLCGTPERITSRIESPGPDRPPEVVPSVLPFNHPILDRYLADVRLKLNGVMPESPSSQQIFQELTHWHNARTPVDHKHVAKPLGFFAKKRHQKFMSDTIAYSASLTGASGKNIDPETIIVCDATTKGKKAVKGPHAIKEEEKRPKAKQAPNGGKQKALEQGEARRLEKLTVLSRSVAATWRERCLEFERQPSMLKRYLKAEKYLSTLSSTHEQIVGAEVLLYISNVLLQIQRSPTTPESAVPGLLAMFWSKASSVSKLPLTEDISSQLAAMEDALRITLGRTAASMSPSAPARPLAFKPLAVKGTKLLPAGATPREFLLEHCGAYLERSFGSMPDSRVTSFHPDAWQRKVLDAIDANKSVLTVAPTSAGKTFISFYAMKKVLQANNDDILVYVAPTKALVNQIAAEIQARFSKRYGAREGRSVWAIHTRDYRVNSCKGCQILVTVPAMLQILLLAPSNARGPQDFSRRIKRIIFDEVHCIGQSDEGVIWEQLLLLAPCPIIALSATIGNPDDFKSWLERSQKAKGFELEMIVHSSRYSDLRKFIHDPPPSVSEFAGLAPVERLPFPGLDSELGEGDATPFLFVHPIGCVVNKDRDTLNDAQLEPRDCLSLWKCMKRLQNAEYTIPPSLHPDKALPALPQKSDVVRWETALKDQLAKWMHDPKSPFDALREELRGRWYSRFASSYYDAVVASGDREPPVDAPEKGPMVSSRSVFSLVTDLRTSGALPAILFNYDRMKCETIVSHIFSTLRLAERKYRETDPTWIAKMAEFEEWKKAQTAKKKKVVIIDQGGKAELERQAASRDISKWERFDPSAPLARFSFADATKMSGEELEERLRTIQTGAVRPRFISALRRGLGVHHAGMNRQYRQVVEMLFRKGYLTVVVATGTLAMGINMPCKTVVFTGDSIYLTALNYRQASGRAGRRGFDVLGNIVFHDIPPHRAMEIMSAKLPDLRGQFPTSVTLILRLFILLHGTDNSDFAAGAVRSLLTQTRLYLGGPAAKMSITHHLRFSIDYLRRQHLLSPTGAPLNFAGLIGHLYYTESAAFAFHALLHEGYFHEVCAGFSPSLNPAKRRDMALDLVLVLSHLFARIPYTRTAARTSLPALSPRAYEILERHNAQTLATFRDYARSYATQHLADAPDDSLPLTRHQISPSSSSSAFDRLLPCLPPVTIRSPFAALSGFGDADFSTVHELCATVRAGVPLEASVVPGVPLDGTACNSYLLDFFKHGDVTSITRDNGVKAGDVWFRLKDFSLVLATVVTSLAGFLRPGGVGDEEEKEEEGEEEREGGGYEDRGAEGEREIRVEEVGALETTLLADVEEKKRGGKPMGKGKNKLVADSWEAEALSGSESELEPEERWDGETPGLVGTEGVVGAPSWTRGEGGQSLVKVYEAFRMVQSQFDEKFLKMWA